MKVIEEDGRKLKPSKTLLKKIIMDTKYMIEQKESDYIGEKGSSPTCHRAQRDLKELKY